MVLEESKVEKEDVDHKSINIEATYYNNRNHGSLVLSVGMSWNSKWFFHL